MCSKIIIYASKLTKFRIVNVFYRYCPIKLLNPQTHAHIFHFEELQREEKSVRFVDGYFITVNVITDTRDN
jgi:hypothetical protein